MIGWTSQLHWLLLVTSPDFICRQNFEVETYISKKQHLHPLTVMPGTSPIRVRHGIAEWMSSACKADSTDLSLHSGGPVLCQDLEQSFTRSCSVPSMIFRRAVCEPLNFGRRLNIKYNCIVLPCTLAIVSSAVIRPPKWPNQFFVVFAIQPAYADDFALVIQLENFHDRHSNSAIM